MNADLRTLKRLRSSRRMLAATLAAAVVAVPFPALIYSSSAIAQEAAANTLTITPAQLQSVITQGLPHEKEWLGGMAKLTLSNPVVAIPMQGNRIQMDLGYKLNVTVDGRQELGTLRMASGLRYNPATRALYLLNPELLELRDVHRSPAVDDQTRTLINALLQDYAKDQPVYRLDQDALSQVPGNLGADAIRIENGQVHLTFGP